MKKEIINTITAKFILGIPEGMFLEEHDWANMEIPDHEKEKYRRYFSSESDSGYMATDRQKIWFGNGDSKPLSLLTELYYKTKFERKSRTSAYYEDYYERFDEKTYKGKVIKYFLQKSIKIKEIIDKCESILSKENINEKDTVFVNIGKRTYDFEDPFGRRPRLFNTFTVEEPNATYSIVKTSNCREIVTVYADIFIISKERFRKITVAPGGVLEYIEHLIKRDVKRLNIYSDNMLEIYFHGVHDPETIVLKDYDDAIKAQAIIMKLRNSNNLPNFRKKTFNKIDKGTDFSNNKK